MTLADASATLDLLEAFQTEQALLDRLDTLAKAEATVTPGSLEADMVATGIRYTASALTRLQLAIYGDDEPDEPSWMLPTSALTESEARAMWGDR